MNRTEKAELIADLKEGLEGAPTILLADLSGVDANTTNDLRALFYDGGVRCQVVKNTLIRRVIEGSSMESIEPFLKGPTALVWHPEEPAAAAKILKAYLKENDKSKVEIKAGWVEGDILEGEAGLKLADMLGKDELRAQLLGLMKMVPGTFLALLNTAPRKFLALLLARKADLEEKGEE